MKALIKIVLFLILVPWHVGSIAQTEATAKLDTNVLLIGDQTELELSFSCPADYTVHWPVITDTIIKEIEVLKHSDMATIPNSDQTRVLYRQSYTITSFDSGYFAVPPIPIGYKKPGDTTLYFAETEALLLQVNNIPVDMNADIKDIKGPLRAPFTFREALPYILILLGAGLIGYLLYYYIRKRKKAEPIFAAPAPRRIPADQKAIEDLESLRYKKLWQSGEIKQYHTQLTDIVREYLWEKFSIHAHEFTTDEIMAAVNGTQANFQAKEKLHQTLVLADMVKFAKMQPLPLEHDGSLNNAIDFVKETRHLNNAPEAREERQDQDGDQGPEEKKDTAVVTEDHLVKPGAGKEVKNVE